MAEAVFPSGGAQPAGILPFLYLAELRDLNGAILADVPCSVWPAGGTSTAARGRHHTHVGEAHIAHATQLQQPNRRLVIGPGPLQGVYTILSAIPQPFVPHVQLELVSRAS